MTMFEIRQCTHPDCGLRMPIDPTVHKGDFCPRCGAPMLKASAPFQHQGSEHSSVVPKRRICILLDNIRSTHNVGAIFRTADGVGARHLYLCGYTPSPSDNSAIQKTALGAEITLSWSQHLNALALAQNLQNQGHYLLALETTASSQPIFNVDLASLGAQQFLLAVGNEQAGIDPGLLTIADLVVSVPMVGLKASLNVSVAFGIAAYWLSFL
jgi:23S rRNA (guanosine2251-2'-O)-methyltransferase